MPAKAPSLKIVLTLDYLPPSQNVLKRSHWTEQYREKQKAFDALQLSLRSIAFDYGTGTITLPVRKICVMAYDTLRLYRAIQKGKSTSKLSK